MSPVSERGFVVSRIRKRHCGHGDCIGYARTALWLPVMDIAPGDKPGMARIPLCGDHLVSSILAFTETLNRKKPTK